ncbi:hypothetical protein VB602_11210 [Vibrio parahaemolyticus]|nr:hypothetical protein [Vibrio parahaemolyticus]EIZ9932446.1 hypothetical protein [Vibrio parahaemolyticus]EJE4161419.1 hypothetical protein [Vibrio parahaemolyticus]EJE8526209.1 hypothetical protein [Vibrio parahaemolyticus]EJG1206514.1 hypothetical protein [Vibrio parahaemolyticus]EJG1661973.1 hypothetical protein [Vibrio parahaemolyticus]
MSEIGTINLLVGLLHLSCPHFGSVFTTKTPALVFAIICNDLLKLALK